MYTDTTKHQASKDNLESQDQFREIKILKAECQINMMV